MLLFPNCKINIGLRVVAKRHRRLSRYRNRHVPGARTVRRPRNTAGCDGRHFVHFVGTGNGRRSRTQYLRSGLTGTCREACPIGGVRMHLHKTIPMGAGLGGGSADAALTIKGLAELFGVPLTAEQMIRLAAQVGSDVPFFIDGRAERFEHYRPGRKPRSRSGFADRTQAGHRQTGRIGQYGRSLRRRRARTARKPARRFVRAAAPAMERTHRQRLRDIRFPHSSDDRGDQKEELYRAGALYASMSGSGSAVYGIFEERTPDLPAFEGMFVYQEDMI